jgi:hypothetical protein
VKKENIYWNNTIFSVSNAKRANEWSLTNEHLTLECKDTLLMGSNFAYQNVIIRLKYFDWTSKSRIGTAAFYSVGYGPKKVYLLRFILDLSGATGEYRNIASNQVTNTSVYINCKSSWCVVSKQSMQGYTVWVTDIPLGINSKLLFSLIACLNPTARTIYQSNCSFHFPVSVKMENVISAEKTENKGCCF